MSIAAKASDGVARSPPLHWLAAVVALCGVVWLYRDTFASVVATWRDSSTFNHGFLVPVAAAALLVANARTGPAPALKPSALALLALVGLGALWVVGRVAGLAAIENVAAVAMLPATLWAMLGDEFARRNLFPLAFLLFAAPLGEGLVQPLMDFTAWFVVRALTLTGIPVYREGLFFSIPSGDFEVARACSGIRYLIATLALGSVFAYLTFGSWRRRLWFMLACVAVPIVANGVRAYGIVLIAHFSDMRLAVGVDHFIYGWLFFGVIIAILFAVGGRFADLAAAPRRSADSPPARSEGRYGVSLALVLAAVAAAPAVLGAVRSDAPRSVTLARELPRAVWTVAPPATDWHPAFVAPAAEEQLRYASSGGSVDVYAAVYLDPGAESGELVHSANAVYSPPWVVVARGEETVRLGDDATLAVNWTSLRLPVAQRYRLVWHWYEVDGRRVARGWWAKALESWRALRGAEGSAAVVAVATEYGLDAEAARERLTAFLEAHHEAVSEWVAGAGARP